MKAKAPMGLSVAPRLARHFAQLRTKLQALAPAKRLLLAGALGLLAAGALPPLYLLPLLLPAFTGLLWLAEAAHTRRQLFLIGWAFGGGWFFAGLYWVGIAMTVDLSRFWWFLPISVLGLAIGLGLFTGFAVWLLGFVPKVPAARLFALAGSWTFAEYLRSWVLTGFPWNPLGSVWGFSSLTLQPAALLGVWLLSFATILLAGLPSLFSTAGRVRSDRVVALLLGLFLPVVLLGYSALRLSLAPALGADVVEAVELRLVQPAIPQSLKWDPEERAQHVLKQVALSNSPGYENITHILWSETAVPYALNLSPDIIAFLRDALPNGLPLITGAVSVETGPEEELEHLYNSLLLLDEHGRLSARYDKHHLVPFGEYVPLQRFLPLEKITTGMQDFTAGPGARNLVLAGLPPASPLICYEVIFPGAVTPKGERPAWLLNLTNDGWFGVSSGPFQHFVAARLRAVEEGLPLVRVANNGISGVLDPYGRIIASLPLDAVGIIDSPLPKAIPPTLYAKVQNFSVAFLVVLALIGVRITLHRQ